MKRISLILIFTFFVLSLQSQNPYPQNYFRSPVDFRILLSGTFGELRPDHFHMGIDIKTNSVEGANVYAPAEGYVSRIKISAFGYGKSIYMTHPNGYVTVYAHLSKLDDKLDVYVKEHQYKRKSYEIDLYLKKDQFHYAKGDIIALSGNSGGSGGPHLHFEIRDEKTQEPLNPLLFGFDVKDFLRPLINSIRIYPVGKKPVNLELSGWGENYRLKEGDTIGLPKSFYLGINTIDKQNDTPNNNGVYEVALFFDSLKVYGNRQERLSFSTGRYINTFIDYAYYSEYKTRFQKAYIGSHNKLKIYNDVINNGLIQISDSLYHQIRYQVADANGNKSILSFYAFAASDDKFEAFPQDTIKKTVFYFDTENKFESDNFRLDMPKNALYDSLYFHFDVLSDTLDQFSPIYRVHKKEVPLQTSISLSLKLDSIPELLKSKLLIARVEDENYSTSSIKWEGAWATVSIRNFGDYTVIADTVQPQIKWINTLKNKTIAEGTKIKFKVKDELSGIKTYNGYFNGEWILFEHDAKNNLIFHTVEKKRLADKNKILIEVVDKVGNKAVFERTFDKP